MSDSENIALIKTKFIGHSQVAAAMDWPSAIAALRAAYAGEITPEMTPPRTMARGKGYWLRSLSALSPSGEYMGCKLIAASPKTKRASYLISLFDQNTMDLAALLDGNGITGVRTAATSAVAVDLLAPDKPLRVGVIGTGFEARGLLEALCSVRAIERVRVYSPTVANRERFAAAFSSQHGISVSAVNTPSAAVSMADVVLCAARSRDESPVLQGDWLSFGAVVVSVGSTLPEQREVDETTLRRASLIVADMPEEVLHETGDALAARQAGVDLAGKTVSLNDVASGRRAGRTSSTDVVVYKSVGSALQDIVIAEMVLKRTLASGNFQEMPESIYTIYK